MARWSRLRSKLPSKLLVKVYLVTFFNAFSSSFVFTMVFPYLPFMMEFLIPSLQEDQKSVGKYAGFIGGGIYFGRIFGSYIWGVIADRKGRKPVIVASLIGYGVFSLMFGFSVNYAMALLARCLTGVFDGLMTTSKVVLSDLSDDSNQAVGFAVYGTAWGAGVIIGPAVSGAIADPVGQYNLSLSNSFLRDYFALFPYSLPSIVSLLLFITSIVATLLFLPETLHYKEKKEKEQELGEVSLCLSDALEKERGDNERSSTDDLQAVAESSFNGFREEEEALLESSCAEGNRTTNSVVKLDHPGAPKEIESSGERLEKVEEENREIKEEKERSKDLAEQGKMTAEEPPTTTSIHITVKKKPRHLRCYARLLATFKKMLLDLRLFLCHRDSLIAIVVYCTYSMVFVGFTELFSLWAYTQPHLGGLGLSLQEIGITLTIVGVLMLPITLLAYPLLEKRLQNIKTFYLVGTILTFLFPITPTIHYLLNYGRTWIFWGVLIILLLILNGTVTVALTSSVMFINNSVTSDKLGSFNGVAMTLTSITRTVAPVIYGSIFSASLSDATLEFGFPVDYNLVFVLLSVTMLICVLMVACLPLSINRQKLV